ncbi:cyclopropane-fatty-acyl-phospholipid synthase family protein [Nostoc sp. TCL26-01]|uniref:SAM-dependent methyltransferase n=1 Tax=Nostoc sp. TCL26-01 TaxID=2576904 RepID=UPI0015B96184|nr:methyltransferase domain-containing protein [Nostoc sp. TCL26-01]QLE58775.1 methyltransferase domain-containing protein [Nostoc sp. TCL26-01]
MNSVETIVNYFDHTLPIYRKYWYRNSESYALHYGFWEKDTQNFSESLVNTNKFLADKLNIKASDTILDAGCGVGGSTIWLAKTFQAKVIGITISEKQVEEAKKLAKANHVEHLVDFQVQNYLNTNFLDESFDVVWAIESVCYAEQKQDFLQEAFRLLKHGGRLGIADGFQGRDFQHTDEVEMMNVFNEGLAIPNIAKISDFKDYLNDIGFKNVELWDKTQAVLHSARRIYLLCSFIYPLRRILKIFKPHSRTLAILEKNNCAGIVQYKLVKSGLGAYAVFSGEKP